MSRNIRETFSYIICGALTTLVNFALFYLLSRPLGLNSVAANAISVVCAILFAYFANKLIVFRKKSKNIAEMAGEMLSFFGARGVTMLLEISAVPLFSGVLGFHDMSVKIAATVAVVILNYIFGKFYVFRRP